MRTQRPEESCDLSKFTYPLIEELEFKPRQHGPGVWALSSTFTAFTSLFFLYEIVSQKIISYNPYQRSGSVFISSKPMYHGGFLLPTAWLAWDGLQVGSPDSWLSSYLPPDGCPPACPTLPGPGLSGPATILQKGISPPPLSGLDDSREQ